MELDCRRPRARVARPRTASRTRAGVHQPPPLPTRPPSTPRVRPVPVGGSGCSLGEGRESDEVPVGVGAGGGCCCEPSEWVLVIPSGARRVPAAGSAEWGGFSPPPAVVSSNPPATSAAAPFLVGSFDGGGGSGGGGGSSAMGVGGASEYGPWLPCGLVMIGAAWSLGRMIVAPPSSTCGGRRAGEVRTRRDAEGRGGTRREAEARGVRKGEREPCSQRACPRRVRGVCGACAERGAPPASRRPCGPPASIPCQRWRCRGPWRPRRRPHS